MSKHGLPLTYLSDGKIIQDEEAGFADDLMDCLRMYAGPVEHFKRFCIKMQKQELAIAKASERLPVNVRNAVIVCIQKKLDLWRKTPNDHFIRLIRFYQANPTATLAAVKRAYEDAVEKCRSLELICVEMVPTLPVSAEVTSTNPPTAHAAGNLSLDTSASTTHAGGTANAEYSDVAPSASPDADHIHNESQATNAVVPEANVNPLQRNIRVHDLTCQMGAVVSHHIWTIESLGPHKHAMAARLASLFSGPDGYTRSLHLRDIGLLVSVTHSGMTAIASFHAAASDLPACPDTGDMANTIPLVVSHLLLDEASRGSFNDLENRLLQGLRSAEFALLHDGPVLINEPPPLMVSHLLAENMAAAATMGFPMDAAMQNCGALEQSVMLAFLSQKRLA